RYSGASRKASLRLYRIAPGSGKSARFILRFTRLLLAMALMTDAGSSASPACRKPGRSPVGGPGAKRRNGAKLGLAVLTVTLGERKKGCFPEAGEGKVRSKVAG